MLPQQTELRKALFTVDLKELNSVFVNNTVTGPLHQLTIYVRQQVMKVLGITSYNIRLSIPVLSYATIDDCVTYIILALGINTYVNKLRDDIADVISTAMYSLLNGVHGHDICEDFVQHWLDSNLEVINTEYRDALWLNMNQQPAENTISADKLNTLHSSLNMHMQLVSGDRELTGIDRTIEEAVILEFKLLHCLNVPKKALGKLAKYLGKHKFNKYSKLLDKWGYVPGNLLKDVDGTWVVRNAHWEPIPTLEEDLNPFNFGSMVFKPDTSESILNFKPTATDPIEQSLEVDRFYISHNVTMIPPMSFGKTLSEVIFLQGTGLMTMEKVEAEVTKMLKYILGPDMYKYVSLDQSKEGLAISVKSQDSKIMDAIANKLAYTLILN